MTGVKIIDGVQCADGGRLFYVVGKGRNVNEARGSAYEAMSLVSIEGNRLQYRTERGYRDVNRLKQVS